MEELKVLLNDRLVGSLTRLPGGRSIFGFDESYASDPHRPTLSQFYIDSDGELRTETRPAQNKRLPNWFSNLLPEGPLRTYLAKRGDIRPDAEFDLLALLAEDLPGAVRLVATDGAKFFNDYDREEIEEDNVDRPLHFSLAGVQLKFSGIVGRHGGLTIPTSGAGGDWIVKLPSSIYPHVPENEATMLTLAAEIGMDVPEHRLVAMGEIEGLPELGSFAGRQALAVKRFDRGPEGSRIHIEDLAQVFGIAPDDKYEKVGYATIARLLGLVMGAAAAQEFVRRLVFTALTGNGDMHLKNWSLIYPDGRTPELSPAYDLVSTIPYIPEDRMALNIAGKKEFSELTKERFRVFAQKAEIPERETLRTVERTVEATMEAWTRVKSESEMEDSAIKVVELHLQRTAHRLR